MAVLDNIKIEQGSVYRYILMSEESITLEFTSDGDKDIPYGTEYVLPQTKGLPKSAAGKYVLLTTPSKNTDGLSAASRYTVTLDKEYFKTKNYLFKYMPKTGGAEASWSLTAHMDVFAEVLKSNLSTIDCGIDSIAIDTEKKMVENSEGVMEEKDVIFASGAMALSFSSTSIFDAINAIAKAWECEWWVENRILHFGKCERKDSETFSYDTNVESSTPVQAKQVPNKFYVFGSATNIPYWYRKEVDTTGVELSFANYTHSLIEPAIALTPFGEDGNQSLVYEGEQSVFVYWGRKCSSLTQGEYVNLDFSTTHVNVTRDADANGRIRAYLQYSQDNKKYITLDSYYITDVAGDMLYHKTKTYMRVDTGEVYLRLYLEFESDGGNAYGHFNAAVNFEPRVNYVKCENIKNYTLPSSCFKTPTYKESDYSDTLKSAVVQNRLAIDHPIDRSNGGMVIESVLVFDDIKPKSLCTATVLESKEYLDEIELADGTIEKQAWKAYRLKAPDYINDDCILSGKTLAIHFETGALAGMEFDVAYDPDGIGDATDERTHVLEIIRNDRYGRYLPDSTLVPSGQFYMLNFDVSCITPKKGANGEEITLITEAEAELQKTAEEYIDQMYQQTDNLECTMRVDNDDAYEVGTSVSFGGRDDMRVISMEIPLDLPYDHPKYTLGQKPNYSTFGALKEEIESVAKDGGSYVSGTNIYLIRTIDSNPATNDNVYSAKRSDWNYLSKQDDDAVKGLITFAQGLVSMGIIRNVGKFITLQSFESSDYKRNETGFYLGPEFESRGEKEKAESRLEVDNLYVRNAIQYSMLNIKKRTYIGGSLAVTCGSAELIKVYSYTEAQERIKAIEDEMLSLGNATQYEIDRYAQLDKERKTYIGMVEGAYRCWFKNEQDGLKINNDFVVGDFACKETFNLTENSYYWRKVVGVGADYVDLSIAECDTNRDNNAPQAGDTIVQLGNEDNANRQNAIFILADSDDAPAIITYHGINSFVLEDHEAILQKYDSASGRMKLTVYGDCYVGDKGGENYLSFDRENGLSVMANNISFKTGEGTSDSVSNSFVGIKNDLSKVKEQSDHNFTIWSAKEIPTNDNYPAVNWKTDEEKDRHEEDLLYYKYAGKTYRYINRQWEEVTDQDTIRALEQVKERCRGFVDQPVPPYEVGDMWMYAYYKDDNHNYNGDLLRCRKSKKEGEVFSIEDWTNAMFLTKSGFEQNNASIKQWVEGHTEDNNATLRAEMTTKVENGMAVVEQKVTGAYNSIEEAVKDGQRIITETYGTASANITSEAGEGVAAIRQEAKVQTEVIKTYVEGEDGKGGVMKTISDADVKIGGYVKDSKSYTEQTASLFTQTKVYVEGEDGKSGKLKELKDIVTQADAGFKSLAENTKSWAEQASTYKEDVKEYVYGKDGNGGVMHTISESESRVTTAASAAEANASLTADHVKKTGDDVIESRTQAGLAATAKDAAEAAKEAAEKAKNGAEDAQAVVAETKQWVESGGATASIKTQILADADGTLKSKIEAVADAMNFAADKIDFSFPDKDYYIQFTADSNRDGMWIRKKGDGNELKFAAYTPENVYIGQSPSLYSLLTYQSLTFRDENDIVNISATDIRRGGESIVTCAKTPSTGTSVIKHIVYVSQAEYDISEKNINTLYVII